MNAQEIINYIATAPKKTPVKIYVNLREPVDFASCGAKVFGEGLSLVVFGNWADLEPVVTANAAAIADTLALGLVLLGVMVAVGFRAVLWKLVLVLVIQWYTSPLSSHMLAQFEYRAGQEDLARYLELPEETEEVSAP